MADIVAKRCHSIPEAGSVFCSHAPATRRDTYASDDTGTTGIISAALTRRADEVSRYTKHRRRQTAWEQHGSKHHADSSSRSFAALALVSTASVLVLSPSTLKKALSLARTSGTTAHWQPTPAEVA